MPVTCLCVCNLSVYQGFVPSLTLNSLTPTHSCDENSCQDCLAPHSPGFPIVMRGASSFKDDKVTMVKPSISVIKRIFITRLIITGICLCKRDEWYPQRLLVGLLSKCKRIYEHVNVYSPRKLRKGQFLLLHIYSRCI